MIRGLYASVLDRDLEEETKKPGDPEPPRIRCPLCGWSPRKEDRWFCECGHSWNTFDTGGVCPACLHQWAETHCLSCSRSYSLQKSACIAAANQATVLKALYDTGTPEFWVATAHANGIYDEDDLIARYARKNQEQLESDILRHVPTYEEQFQHEVMIAGLGCVAFIGLIGFWIACRAKS